MQSPIHQPFTDAEERLEAWLSHQPLTPAPDFVARTLARIRAESTLVASAKAGDDAALESLLDRWLGEQPLDPNFEPSQLATQTRRTAADEEREESRPEESSWRRVVPFPAWARSTIALAAAAAVVILAYFGTVGPTASIVTPSSSSDRATAQNLEESSLPDPGEAAYNPNALSQLNDQLKDGQALLDSDVMALLPGNDNASDDSAIK